MTTKQINRNAMSETDYLNELTYKLADNTAKSFLESFCVAVQSDDEDVDYKYDTSRPDATEGCAEDVQDALDYLHARNPKELPFKFHFEGDYVWFTDED